jgi:hypothetical protein
MRKITNLIMAPEFTRKQRGDKSKEFTGTNSPAAIADSIPMEI